MKRNIVFALVGFCALPVADVRAQGGPWTDGEILVQAPSQPPNTSLSLYRIAPETGHGEALLSGFAGYGGWAGRIAFDSYRYALLVNLALPPDGPFTYKLWAVNSDGSKTSIPGFTGAVLRALAPVGDGRVYFQSHTPSPTEPIKYLDAFDVVHTLMDATDTAPFPFPVEHMLYHAPSNSLIASTSNWWSSNDCAPLGASIFRIPLSADGSHVDGPVLCNSTSALYAAEEIMGLDYLPGGSILVTMAAGTSSFTGDKLISVDPWTLAISGWAHPTQWDINGGCYSSRIGKAVILDDGTNELRTFAPGQNDAGTQLVCDVPLGDIQTGYSPSESMWEIDVNGPGCFGSAIPFGAGLAGSNAIVPLLGVVGCPDVGSPFTISIDNVLGSAPGLLLAGPAPAAIPIVGGFLYVDPILQMEPFTVSGPLNNPGVGSFGLPIFVTDPAVTGLVIFLQAGFVDPGAVQGFSLTNGLKLIIG